MIGTGAGTAEYRRRASWIRTTTDRLKDLTWIDAIKFGRFDELIAASKKRLVIDPVSFDELLSLGITALLRGRVNEAEPYLRKVADSVPTMRQPPWLALALVLMGRDLEALAYGRGGI